MKQVTLCSSWRACVCRGHPLGVGGFRYLNMLPARPFKLLGEFAYHQTVGFVGPVEWVGDEEADAYEADFCALVVCIMNGKRIILKGKLGRRGVDNNSRELNV